MHFKLEYAPKVTLIYNVILNIEISIKNEHIYNNIYRKDAKVYL